MSLFKKTTTRHLAPLTKARVKADTPGAVVERVKSAKWYGRYRDADDVVRTVALARDKSAARALLAELERDADRGRARLTVVDAAHVAAPAVDHLEAYSRYLAAGDNPPRYVREQTARIRKVLTATRTRVLRDLTSERVAQHLAARRRDGSFGPQTSNHYLAACKGFSKWLVRDGRLAKDPLQHVSSVNARTDARRVRRAATAEEFAAIVSAAEAGTRKFGMSGPDRAILYHVAAYTGLRASELASLSPASFDLDGIDGIDGIDGPTVTVAAAYSKHRREDVQPLHPDSAARLRDWLAAKAAAGLRPDAPLWPGRWAGDRKAAPMLRHDL
ncbi:tyrosine recombinase XerC [Alienimonas sp. DA493]|uniref:site-specific integrase n=1 Tax=Alienimonas sp. DA493 TaxID=3373605 RepID=UPI00375533D6